MPSSEIVLAIDQGTTGTTCLLVDRLGQIRSRGYAALRSTYPADGWVEQDPNEIWDSVLKATTEALGAEQLKIAAIGIANQRETTILWDSHTGEPLAPAIVWQDRRTAQTCQDLMEQGYDRLVQDITGLLLDPYFSATKIHWLLKSSSQLANAARSERTKFGTVDSWLVWKLTDGQSHVTDATNASRTMLCDIERVSWSDDLLSIFNIPLNMLPEIVSNTTRMDVTRNVACIPDGVPITGMAGDQHAALFGQACFDPEMLKVTYGTGCFLLANMGPKRSQSRGSLLETIAWQIDSTIEYALEGSVFVGGSAIQWLRDDLQIIGSAAESELVASEVPDAAGVVVVPAFAGLGAPYWDPHARGLIVGLTRDTKRGHIVRATLEAIAHQVTDLAEAISQEGGLKFDNIRVDGGASRNNLLMQLQADFLQTRVLRPTTIETTALGAAFLAGLSIGLWDSKEELRSIWQLERDFLPTRNYDITHERQSWAKAVTRSLNWANT